MNAIARLRATFAARADQPALIDTTEATVQTLTFGELDRQAGAVVEELRRRGARPGDRVLAMLGNGIDMPILLMACLKGGFSLVPVAADVPLELRAHLTGLTRPSLAVTSAALVDFDPERQWVLPRAGTLAALTGECRGWEEAGRAPLLIAFTSGTTSRPKGVCHGTETMLANVEAFNRLVGLGPGSRMLHVMPMIYMAGLLNTILSPLAAGGTVIVAPAFDARSAMAYWARARTHGADCTWLSPTMAALLAGLTKPGDLNGMAMIRVFCGTAPLPAKVREDFLARCGFPLLESYGMTEVLLTAAVPPAEPLGGTVGRLLDGIEIQTRDKDGQPLAPGSEGELWFKSPYRMQGYLGHDGTLDNAQTDGDGWFQSGDLGVLDAQGWLRVTGRCKDIIIKGGTNVSPRAVEEALLACNGVADAAVAGIEHPFWGEEIVAFLQLHPGAEAAATESAARTLCAELLPPVAMPSRFVVVPDFPRTATGKPQKRLLLDQLTRKTA